MSALNILILHFPFLSQEIRNTQIRVRFLRFQQKHPAPNKMHQFSNSFELFICMKYPIQVLNDVIDI